VLAFAYLNHAQLLSYIEIDIFGVDNFIGCQEMKLRISKRPSPTFDRCLNYFLQTSKGSVWVYMINREAYFFIEKMHKNDGAVMRGNPSGMGFLTLHELEKMASIHHQ